MYLFDIITIYCPIIIITIGTIGCICNFITFTSRKLRKTSCSLYFLSATIFDFLTLDFGALTRLLSDHFGYNLEDQSRIYCKMRIYLVSLLPATATSFIVLAAMDRFMSTSTKAFHRSLCTVKHAIWFSFFSVLFCAVSYIHYVVFSDVQPTCTLPDKTYSVFTLVFAIVWTTLIPHTLMLYFACGTQSHIRQARRRILPVTNDQRRAARKQVQFVIVG